MLLHDSNTGYNQKATGIYTYLAFAVLASAAVESHKYVVVRCRRWNVRFAGAASRSAGLVDGGVGGLRKGGNISSCG